MHIPKGLGPSLARPKLKDVFLAGLGAALALMLASMLVFSPTAAFGQGVMLIAPFGASAVLIFAAPSSPLAQPWSVVVGSVLAALVGVAVSLVVPEPTLRVASAVGLAISAMAVARAVHPPAGAIAMMAALNPELVEALGFGFALAPVGLGAVLLVALGMGYARLTGRHYPARAPATLNANATRDPSPIQRVSLSEADLVELLERNRQSLNLGVVDLARLIGAAAVMAAGKVGPSFTAGDFMSRDLVTVRPEASLAEVVEIFARHHFTSLPVVDVEGAYQGVIFQIHLILQEKLLLAGGDGVAGQASELMVRDVPQAQAATPLAALLPLMADGDVDAVPILEGARLVGIVTRTDLIAALSRGLVRQMLEGEPPPA